MMSKTIKSNTIEPNQFQIYQNGQNEFAGNLRNRKFSEFNSQFQIYQRKMADSSGNLLSRSLSLLSGSEDINDFNSDTVDSCQFYINIHSLLMTSDPKSDILWLCISVLQQATKNLEARQAIVYQFRFVPSLTRLLTKITAQDKVMRLLSLLQEVTYGIQITWEEPYLADLIQALVDLIYGDEESLAVSALSVLINICHNNHPCIYLLMRTVRCSQFAEKIKSFGILANKMFIILDNSVDVPSVLDMQSFIKKSFLEIKECLQNWNVPYLRHIVDFLMSSRDHEGLRNALTNYKNFSEDVEHLLSTIDARLEMDDSHGDYQQKNQQICISLIFEMLDYILALPKNEDSAPDLIMRIFGLAIKWINCDNVSAKALKVVESSVKLVQDKHNNLCQIINILESILPQLISITESAEVPNQQTTSIFKLLVTLLQNSRTQKLVLSMVTDSYFDKMFAPLLTVNPEMLNHTSFPLEYIAKYILCLLILVEFYKIAENVWLSKILSMFKSKQIYFILAKGMLCEDEFICAKVLEISKLQHFPREEIAKIVTQLRPLLATKPVQKPLIEPPDQGGFIGGNDSFISKTLEVRLDSLITNILESVRKQDLDNIATSELIELFNYKINLYCNSEKNLLQKLENANTEITNLSHRLSLQSNEITKYHGMNFKLHLLSERLQAQNSDLIKQSESLKRISSELSKKAELEKIRNEELTKSKEVKRAEIGELRKEIEKYKEVIARNTSEIKQLQASNKEYTARNDKMKENIKLLEETVKKNRRTLEENDKELTKACKIMDELRSSNSNYENLIKHLESQLAEKNEAIRGYEMELSETEEMRKTILSIMESKKPKRKN